MDMYNNTRTSGWYSWPAIILMFIIFFPVGIYLLVKRSMINKKTALNIYKGIKVVGWIFVIESLILIFSSASDPEIANEISSFYNMLLFGIAFLVWGAIMKKKSLRYQKYISLIINERMSNLDNISSAMSLNYGVVKSDLQKMINRNYFQGAYIDEGLQKICIPNLTSVDEDDCEDYDVVEKAITCSNCGAKSIIEVGITEECEYCGSPLYIADTEQIVE